MARRRSKAAERWSGAARRLGCASVLCLALLAMRGAGAAGDVDGDGRVTIRDAALALRAVVGLAILSDGATMEADVDGDGRVTVADVALILRWAVGLDVPPPPPITAAWTPSGDALPSPVYSLALAGPQGVLLSASPGLGLFRSRDAGATWAAVSPGISQFAEVLFQDLSISSRLFVGTEGNGLLASNDAGATWSTIPATGLDTVCAIAASPASPGVIYAAGDGIALSADDGQTWAALDPDPGRPLDIHALAADPVHQGVLVLGTRFGQIYRTSDGGITWTQATTPAHVRIFCLVFDPFNTNRLYAGTCTGRFWRSEDGGLTWTEPPGITAPPNFNTILTDPKLPGHLLAGTSGGPLESFDDGDTWSPLGMGLEGKEVLSLLNTPNGLLAGMWTDATGLYRLPGGAFRPHP